MSLGYAVWTIGTVGATTVTSASGTTQASGSTFVAVVNYRNVANGAALPSTVTDSKSNTYTLAKSITYAFGNAVLAIYTAINGTGGTSHTVTASGWAHGGDTLSIALVEFTGVGNAAVDSAPTGNANSVSPSAAPSLTTSINSQLVINAVGTYGNNGMTLTDDSGSGYSIAVSQQTGSGTNGAVSYATPTSSGTSTNDTYTWNSGDDYSGTLAISLKPLGAPQVATGSVALQGNAPVVTNSSYVLITPNTGAVSVVGQAVPFFGIGAHAVVSSPNAGSASTLTTSGVTTQASGSTFVIAVDAKTTTISSISDSKSNTYVLKQQGSGFNKASLYICENGVGGSGHTATVVLSGADSANLYFAEVIGAASSGYDVGNNSNNTSGATSFTGPSVTTTNANDIVIAFAGMYGDSSVSHGGTGFTTIDVVQNAGATASLLSYSIKTATGTYNETYTTSSTQFAAFAIIALKQAGSASTTTITPAVGSVSVAGVAPVISRGTVTKPNIGSVSVAGIAPVLRGGVGLAPSAGAVSVAGIAPVLTIATKLTPTVGAVALVGQTPAITNSGLNVTRQPSAGAVSLAGVAPTVSASVNTTITPNIGAVSLVGIAPTLSISINTRITPNALALALTGIAPTATIAAPFGPGAHTYKSNTPGTPATTVTTNAVTTNASGSVFLILVNTKVQTVTSVSDSKGNTYVLKQTGSGYNKATMYVCEGGTGGSGHTATATVATADSITVEFVELVGCASPAYDVGANGANQAGGTAFTSPTVTTTAAGIVIAFVGFYSESTVTNSGVGFNVLDNENTSGLPTTLTTYALEPTTGTYSDAYTTGSSNYAAFAIASFKQSTGPTNTNVAPQTGAVALAGVSPTITSSNTLLIPVSGSVTFNGQQPRVNIINTLIAPTAGAVALVGQQLVQTLSVPPPAAGTVTLQGIAPTVFQSGSAILGITGAVVVQGYAPQVLSSGANITITPVTASVPLTGQGVIETLSLPPPSAGIVTLQGNQAVVSQSGLVNNTTVTPNTGALALTGLAPTVTFQSLVLTPATGAVVTLTVNAPSVRQNNVVNPNTGLILLQGSAAVVTQDQPYRLITPDTGAVAVSGQLPQLNGQTIVIPNTANIGIAGQVPLLLFTTTVVAQTGAVSIAGVVPTVATSFNTTITPNAGLIAMAGTVPAITNPVTLTPNTAAVLVLGQTVSLAAFSPYTPAAGFVASLPKLKRTAYFGADLFSRD